MELATTQSVLMQIQPTIQRFARMLASVGDAANLLI